MDDLLYLGIGIALFVVAALFTRGEDRGTPEGRP